MSVFLTKNKELSIWKNYEHMPERNISSPWAITCYQLSAEISHNASHTSRPLYPNSQWHLQDLEAYSPAIPGALLAPVEMQPGAWKPLHSGLPSLLRTTVLTSQARQAKHQAQDRDTAYVHLERIIVLSYKLFKITSKAGVVS